MQTTVTSQPVKGFPGLLSDASDLKNAVSACNKEASAEIRFGIMVKATTDPGNALLMTATTNKLKGIVAYSADFHKDLELGDTGLKPGAEMNVLSHGRIWVLVEGTLPAEGDGVHVRVTVTAAEVIGGFRTTADAAHTIDISKLARWTGLTDTGVAELEINLTGAANTVADS